MITLTRPPARIAQQGTFPLGSLGATFTIGHDATAAKTAELMARGYECGVLAVDIEGAGKDGRKRFDVKCVSIGTPDFVVVYDIRDPEQFANASRVINTGEYLLAFHNSPFDVPILHGVGVMSMEAIARVIDTLIWCRLAEPDERTSKALTSAANRYLGLNLVNPLPAMLKVLNISVATWYESKDLDVPSYRIMAASDVVLTHRLIGPAKKAAYDRLTTGHPFPRYGLKGDEALALVHREQVINRMTLRATCRGLSVDPEFLDQYMDTTSGEMRLIEQELEGLGIRPGNAGDLTSYLREHDLLPEDYPVTDKRKEPSTAKKDLATLTAPVAAQYVTHKEVTHILNDYLSKVMDNSDEQGKIHPGTSLLIAATGRMSISGDAPLQQFPEGARGIILANDWERVKPLTHAVTEPCNCPHPSGMVSIDWSQIEPVLVANIAGDTKAVEYYEQGGKFYNAIVDGSDQRVDYKAAKTTLLAQLYGEGITKLARDLKISVEEATKIRELIWQTLPGTAALAGKKGKLQTIAGQHKLIFTLSGRIVPIPSGWWPCWNDHEEQEDIDRCRRCNAKGLTYSVQVHKGTNYFVQGGAYDLLAEAMFEIEMQGLGDALYFAMHDELVVDHAAAHDVRKIMETPPARLIQLAKRTPILRTDMAHLGERWAAA